MPEIATKQELDRTTPPPFKQITKVSIAEPETALLANDIPVYIIHAGTQEVVRIKLLFEAGSWVEAQHLTASATCQMLREGTRNFTSHEISSKLDP